MIKKNLGQLIGSAAMLTCALAIAAPQAQAGQLYQDWNYGIDAVGDGSGGSVYDIKGLAVKETADSIFVALTGGTPLTGVSHRGAANGNVGWGDMFFNFSGKDFKTAQQDGDIFGVRFAETNDSGAPQVGLYSNVTTKSVTRSNVGYGNHESYYSNRRFNKANTMGTDLATKNDVYKYLYGADVAANPTRNNTTITNVIDSGTFLGGINVLNKTQLTAAGLNFGHFDADGPHTFGFQLDKSLLAGALPGGISSFMAHVLLECANDAIAIKGELDIPEQEVPEPTALLGLSLTGLAFLKQRKKRQA